MASILARDNHALSTNPPAGAHHLTTHGSSWLFAVTAIYLISFLAIVLLSVKPFQNERIFHHIFAVALLVGTICYFAEGSDLAWKVVATSSQDTSRFPTYQVFWAKYVNWVVSWAAIVLSLGLLSGVTWTSILYGVSLAWIWVVSFLVSAFTATKYKWGFFVFGMLAYFLLAFHTLFHGTRGARRLDVGGHYMLAAGWVNFLWFLYPIAFGVSDGGNVIGVTQSFVFFGILDLLMLPVLAFLFVVLSRRWDYNRLNLNFTQNGRVPSSSASYGEKGPVAAGPATGAATGPAGPGTGPHGPHTTAGGVTGPAVV